MIQIDRGIKILAVLTVLTLAFVGSTANAERYVEYRGGYFEPWEGDGGYSFAIQIGNSIDDQSYFGGEVEVRRFDGEVLGVKDLDVLSIILRGIYRYDVFNEEHVIPVVTEFMTTYVTPYVIPYVGIGGSLAFNNFDTSKAEEVLEEDGDKVQFPSFGAGLGVIGIIGLEAIIPTFDNWSVFAESRYGYSAQFARKKVNGKKKNVKVDNLGGITAHAGVRLSF